MMGMRRGKSFRFGSRGCGQKYLHSFQNQPFGNGSKIGGETLERSVPEARLVFTTFNVLCI